MTSLIRRNPSAMSRSSVAPRWNALDRLFGEDLFQPMRLFDDLAETLDRRSWMPAVDIRETDDSFEVVADLPGFDKKNVDITLENNVLTLRGERRWEDEAEETSYRRVERSYGEFVRSFSMPNRVDADGVKASFDNGVLTVTVPKSAESKPRRITVN